MKKIVLFLFIILFVFPFNSGSYPIDGYAVSGIRRILYLQMVKNGEIKGVLPKEGAQLGINDIQLSLLNYKGDSLASLPSPDLKLQKAIDAIFPVLHESYSISILDITPGKPLRYAAKNEKKGYQPGSVAKLIVAAGLFNELKKLYPNSFENRRALLKSKMVRGGTWVNSDEHTIPVFDTTTNVLKKRVAVESDVFSLYEWADHMLSVSNNGAASVVWREAILIHAFGQDYPDLTQEQADEYFAKTKRAELMAISVEIINAPLRDIGIPEEELRLGSMFTSGAKKIIPGSGGSLGSPAGFIKYLIALERGKLIDLESSLEIKRLMFMTANRIRYASSASLNTAAVYFKSGSLYQCKPEEGFKCQKYMGNVNNFMNSVIIVEHTDGTKYMVALMSNVLKKNSAADHNALASRIDKALRSTR